MGCSFIHEWKGIFINSDFYFRTILTHFAPFCIWGGHFSGALRAVSLLAFLYLYR